MTNNKEHSPFYYLLRPNIGTWVLIAVHLVILILLITLFSAIIEHMQNY